MRRVVVTGMGAVSPFGFGAGLLWDSVLEGKNGITKIDRYPIKGEIIGIAGSIPLIPYDHKDVPEMKSVKPTEEGIPSFFKAVKEAVEQAGLDFQNMKSTSRVGAFIADRQMGFSDYFAELGRIQKQSLIDGGKLDEKKIYQALEEENFFHNLTDHDPDSINNITSRVYGITGPQLSIGTACASGNNAIGEAMVRIKRGQIDTALAGGAYNYQLSTMIGFTRLGALTANPDPEIACSPFDKRRSGFVMGSGCGVLILEELNHALKRGATIFGEVVGYGSFADAFRATDPDPTASGATRTIKAALDMAGIGPDDIDYINAHGTSTKMNDFTETTAIKNVLGQRAYNIPVSSTKSMIGHSIMATGALEGIVCLKSMGNGVIHGTRNWAERDPDLDLDYVPEKTREVNAKYVLSNNFGFGGQNATVIYKKYEGDA